MQERIQMSQKDLNRLEVLTKIKEQRLSQKDGAKILGITSRHMRQLYCKMRVLGRSYNP